MHSMIRDLRLHMLAKWISFHCQTATVKSLHFAEVCALWIAIGGSGVKKRLLWNKFLFHYPLTTSNSFAVASWGLRFCWFAGYMGWHGMWSCFFSVYFFPFALPHWFCSRTLTRNKEKKTTRPHREANSLHIVLSIRTPVYRGFPVNKFLGELCVQLQDVRWQEKEVTYSHDVLDFAAVSHHFGPVPINGKKASSFLGQVLKTSTHINAY